MLAGVRTRLAAHTQVAALVVAVMLAVGAVLYGRLPTEMATHWNAAGTADGTTSKPVAVLLMPALVVGMSLLFSYVDSDADDRVVGSLAMLVLLGVQLMVFAVNLGIAVPVVPVSLALAGVVVAVAVWFEAH